MTGDRNWSSRDDVLPTPSGPEGSSGNRFHRVPGTGGFRVATKHFKIRRGVREAEGARLESVYGLTPIEGSNPSLSANARFHIPSRYIVKGNYKQRLTGQSDLLPSATS